MPWIDCNVANDSSARPAWRSRSAFLALNKLQTLSFRAFRRASAALEGSCDYLGGLPCAGNFLQAGCVMSADHKIVPHARMKIEKLFVILRSFLVIEIV